jgi:hypothetical protein
LQVNVVSEVDKMQLFDRFADSFGRHLSMLRENGCLDEFDVITKRWESFNPGFLHYVIDKDLLELDAVLQNGQSSANKPFASFHFNHRRTVDLVANELLRVQQRVQYLTPIMSSLSSDAAAFTANLWFQFVQDTIGQDSAATVVLTMLISKLNRIEENRIMWNTNWKFTALIVSTLAYEVVVGVITATAVSQSPQLQVVFITIAAVLLVADMFIAEIIEVLYYWYLLPMCISIPVNSLRARFARLIDMAKRLHSLDSANEAPDDPSRKAKLTLTPTLSEIEMSNKFSVQRHQNPSFIIAEMFPQFAVSKLIAADQEAFPVTVGTPHWPPSSVRVPHSLPIDGSNDTGVTPQSPWILAILYIATVLPDDAQTALLSTFSALVCLCIAAFGTTLSSDPATGVISAVIIILAIICLTVAIAILLFRQGRNRIASGPVDEGPEDARDVRIDIPVIRQSLEGNQECPEEREQEYAEMDDMENRGKIVSRSNSSVVSDSKTIDSLQNYVNAPIEIDFDSVEFDRTHAVFYADSIGAGYPPSTEFLPGYPANTPIEPPLPPPLGFD